MALGKRTYSTDRMYLIRVIELVLEAKRSAIEVYNRLAKNII